MGALRRANESPPSNRPAVERRLVCGVTGKALRRRGVWSISARSLWLSWYHRNCMFRPALHLRALFAGLLRPILPLLRLMVLFECSGSEAGEVFGLRHQAPLENAPEEHARRPPVPSNFEGNLHGSTSHPPHTSLSTSLHSLTQHPSTSPDGTMDSSRPAVTPQSARCLGSKRNPVPSERHPLRPPP